MRTSKALMGLGAARLSVPQTTPILVSRPRVTRLLDAVVRLPLTLVTGGPGTGKTNAVAIWVREGRVPAPVAWVTLDPTLGTPTRVWAAIIGALGSTLPEHGLGELHPPELVDATFIDELSDRLGDHEVVLVLDDVHELPPEALAGLDQLLRIPPPGLHAVLISRRVPVLTLNRHRLAGRLGEVRAADLMFTRDEVIDLATNHDLPMEPGVVDELLRVTGGWAAGLRLALLALSGVSDQQRALAAFRGEQPLVAGYLTEELERSLGTDLFRVLIRTCVVDRVSGPLAAALTGDASATETLRARLGEAPLVAELSDTGWFRYHPLLLQMLRARLRRSDPDLMGELHRRASAWFEEQGEWLIALDHALESGDPSYAIRVALRSATVELIGEGKQSLGKRVVSIPDQGPSHAGEMLLLRAVDGFCREEYEAAAELLARAEPLLGGLPEPDRSVALLNVRMLEAKLARASGDGAAMTSAGRQAAEVLAGLNPTEAPGWARHRGAPLRLVGMGQLWAGRPMAAVAALREADRADAGYPYSGYARVQKAGYFALALTIAGEMSEARELAQAATAYATELGSPSARETLTAWLASAILALQRGDDTTLLRSLSAGDAAVAGGHDPFSTVVMMLVRCHAALHLGDDAGARRELARAARHLATSPLLIHAARLWTFLAVEVELQVNRSVEGARLVLAEHDRKEEVWAAESPGTPVGDTPEVDPLRLVRAQLLLASSQPERVREALAGAEHEAGTMGVFAWILIALAEDQMRHDTLSTEAIGQALDAAQRDGLLMAFRSPAPRLVAILKRYREVIGSHESLIAAVLTMVEGESIPPPRPVEPLTERELAVVAYLPTMRSNAEIAESLDISVNTVKQHLKSVHRKLGVGSRREVVRVVRELDLLPRPPR